jgi:hypothetical protein
MNSTDLTREQAMQVYQETREILGRIYQLKARMDARGFPSDDPVYAATVLAWRAFIVMNQQWQRVACGPNSSTPVFTPPPTASPQPHDQPQHDGYDYHHD